MMRIYIILLICSFSFADYFGGYPGSSFRYASNARQMALGNSIISEYNQGFNAFSNPALLSKTKKYEFGASYFLMTLDRYVQVLSITRNLEKSAGTSLSLFRSGVKDIEGKDLYNQSTGSFDSSESYIMFSFGNNIIESLDFGFNIKAIFNNIENYKASGVSADIGLIYNFSEQLNMALMIHNIYGKYSWNDLGKDESLPMIGSIGLKYGWHDNITLFSRIDYMQPENINLYRFRSGIELNRSNYEIRFGLIQSSGISADNTLAIENGIKDFKILLGFGVNINKFLKLDFCIDFGVENEGINNLISMSFIK